MNLYEEAIKIWIARKASTSKKHMVWAEDITKVKFGEGNYGACPTCDDPYFAIEYEITRNGKKSKHFLDVEEIAPAKIVEECLDIYKTLTLAGKKFYP